MATHVGTINVNIDTSDVAKSSALIAKLGADAASTQRILSSLSTISLTPTVTSANTLARSLVGVTQQANQTGTALRQMTQVQKLDVARDILNIRSFHDIQREIQLTEAAYGRLASSGKLSGKELQVANDAHLASVQRLKNEMNGISGSAGSASGGISGLVSSLTGLGVGPQMLLGIGAAAVSMGKSMYDAYQPVQSLRMGLQALGQDGVSGMMVLRASADKVGMDFIGASKAMMQLTAATAGTKLEGAKTAHMFEVVSNAVKVTGGSTEDANRAFLALSQMLSKGTVQAQELKLQLGNALPGAMRDASDATNMTMGELVKTMEMGAIQSEGFVEKFVATLDKKYGGAMEAAASTTQSQLNLCNNDWQMFSANAGRSIDGLLGSLAQLINQTRILKSMNLSGVIGDANDSNAKAADKQGMGEHGAEILAQYKINALLQSGYKGKINTTEMETDSFGNVSERRLSAEEVWAGIAGSAYMNKDEGLTKRVGAINTKMNDWKGDQEKAAKLKKEREKKDSDSRWETDYHKRVEVANRTGNQHAIGLLEGEKKRRELDLQLRGADGDPIEQARLRAKNAAEVAALEHKGIKKPKKPPKLSEAQHKENAFNSLWDSMDHSIDRTEVNKETSWLDKELVKQNQIWEKNTEKAKRALDAKKINNTQYKKLVDEASRMLAEGSSNVIQTDNQKKADDIQKQVVKFQEDQIKLATSLRKIDLQRQKDLEGILTTHRNITQTIQDEENAANPMNSKSQNEGIARNKYVKDKTSPLQAKADSANDTVNAMRAEFDITVATAEELTKFENATNIAALANKELAQSQREVSAAFDRQLAKSQDLSLSMTGAANAYIQSVDVAKLSTSLATNTVTEFGTTLSEALGSKEGWKNREQGIKNYFASMLTQISNMVIQLGVVKPLMESVFGGASGSPSAGASGWLGAIAKIGMSLAGGSPVEGDKNFMGPVMPKANGGAFNKGVEFFANGGVFNSPTMFNHAGGLGVMGEAGPESIMPLKRGKDGKLGVIASGGGGGAQINNFTPNIVIQGNADDEAIAKMTTALRAEFKQHVSQSINKNNVKSQRPGGMNYR